LQILSALSFVIIGDSCNYLGIDEIGNPSAAQKTFAWQDAIYVSLIRSIRA
jgi:hypothetical protein